MLVHPIPPIYDSSSRVLILGSFPSVRSREQGFYYGHPQNRFWKMLSAVLEKPEPVSVAGKRELLLSSHIALWDVIASCEITGSSGSSIRAVSVNDVKGLLSETNLLLIAVNGKTAMRYYEKHLAEHMNIEAVCLPSTSAANAAWSLDRLIEAWRLIRAYNEPFETDRSNI